jgi:hypothetical protein
LTAVVHNNNNMKRITQMLLSIGVGMNLPSQWVMALGCGGTASLLLSIGIIITAATEWAYYPRNK